jgi:hypothetical protein
MALSKSQFFKISVCVYIFTSSFFVLISTASVQLGWKWGVGARHSDIEGWGGCVTDAAGSVYLTGAYEGGDTGLLGSLIAPDPSGAI